MCSKRIVCTLRNDYEPSYDFAGKETIEVGHLVWTADICHISWHVVANILYLTRETRKDFQKWLVMIALQFLPVQLEVHRSVGLSLDQAPGKRWGFMASAASCRVVVLLRLCTLMHTCCWFLQKRPLLFLFDQLLYRSAPIGWRGRSCR